MTLIAAYVMACCSLDAFESATQVGQAAGLLLSASPLCFTSIYLSSSSIVRQRVISFADKELFVF